MSSMYSSAKCSGKGQSEVNGDSTLDCGKPLSKLSSGAPVPGSNSWIQGGRFVSVSANSRGSEVGRSLGHFSVPTLCFNFACMSRQSRCRTACWLWRLSSPASRGRCTSRSSPVFFLRAGVCAFVANLVRTSEIMGKLLTCLHIAWDPT